MGKRYKITFFLLYLLGVVWVAILLLQGHNIPVLQPKGLIASKERSLMITATLLMLIVVIPVFILTFYITWKYRAGNTKSKYTPEWDHHPGLEFIWWAIPGLIILILAGITWRSSHELDPFKPLNASAKPITIQVVALQWKWLFIYPQQHIATVNYVQFPEKTPVNFEITADAPMNSFWIPQLGGQVYAMAGMNTKLHLMADSVGTYAGSSANLSGRGFAGMKFTAKSSSDQDFNKWVSLVKQSRNKLSQEQYDQLAKPSENNKIVYYASGQDSIFDTIMMRYMHPHDQLPVPEHQHTQTGGVQ